MTERIHQGLVMKADLLMKNIELINAAEPRFMRSYLFHD